jgi:putative selenium metabolism hydrolase
MCNKGEKMCALADSVKKTRKVNLIQDDLVQFTQELIRIPCITGDEKAIAEATLAKLQEIEVDEAWIDGIGNVIGILKGAGTGPNVMLNTHLDMVPAGRRENWDYDPLGAEIDEEGNIFGRGAVDIKGGLTSQLFAMKMLKDIRTEKGIQLPGDVIFSSVVYEEAAECFGMQYLCEKTFPERGITFDVCYLAEPSHGVVTLGHRGKVEVVVTTRGETAHSSTPWAGVNALQLMVPVLDHIFNIMPGTFGTHPDLGQASITVTNLVCRPGGLSIIPDEAEVSIDRRYLPGETLESIMDEFKALFDELKKVNPKFDASIQVRTFHETSYTGIEQDCQKHHPVWVTPKDDPFVQKTIKALQTLGQPAETGYWKFGTDGSWSAGVMGIPTIGFQWGHEKLAHTPIEHISIQQLLDTTEGYAAILCELFDLPIELLNS